MRRLRARMFECSMVLLQNHSAHLFLRALVQGSDIIVHLLHIGLAAELIPVV